MATAQQCYEENGTGPVATYTATDPEEKDIVWGLLTGGDADEFSIDGGVPEVRQPARLRGPMRVAPAATTGT